MQQYTDEQLIEMIGSQDPNMQDKAASSLWKKFSTIAYFIAKEYLKNDIKFVTSYLLGETIIAVKEKITRGETIDNLEAYCKTIIKNKTITLFDQEKRRLDYNKSLEEIGQSKHNYLQVIGSESEDFLFLKKLKEIFDSFEEKDKLILCSHLYSGNQHKETFEKFGGVLNLSYENIRQRYIRAIKKLTEGLQSFKNIKSLEPTVIIMDDLCSNYQINNNNE